MESLTTYELTRLADSFGIDIPPDLERIFIIAEILDIAVEEKPEEEESEEAVLVETSISEPVLLPKQYNITFIEVMIRDPLWAFVFWEIKSQDKEFYEKSLDFEGYCLKVCPISVSAAASKGNNKEEAFTINVGVSDSGWYLGFPPEGGRFKVELCVIIGEKETVIAVSRPFTLPELYSPPNKRNSSQEELYNNPLIQLAGIDDFQVLRSGERKSRNKLVG